MLNNNRIEINLGIIDSSISYWALHFYSILECLSSHKTLTYPAHNLKSFPIWSLSNMKGHYPNSFWDDMERSMRNWGSQYFFIHFLNQNLGLPIVNELKSRLDDLFYVRKTFNYNSFEFFVSGKDSRLFLNLNKRYDEIYPKNFNLSPLQILDLENYSDFCLVLKNTEENKNIGIFGEVEGWHGEKLLRNSFWDQRKSQHCVMGVGAINGTDKKLYMETFYHQGKFPKIIVLFEQSHFIISDFYNILQEFRNMFYQGAYYKCYSRDESIIFIINYIISNWNEPVGTILSFLRSQIYENRNLVGIIEDEKIEIIPSIDAK